MDKRKEKRLHRQGQQIASRDNVHSNIAAAIRDGARMPDLRNDFNDRVLERALADFSYTDYDLIDRLLGKPRTEYNILLDECVNPALLKLVHKKIGRVSIASKVFSKSVSDRDLFQKAQENNVKAIITSDFVSAGERDLCGIAQRAYENKKSAPHVIIVPQHLDNARQCLNAQAKKIVASLDDHCPHDVFNALE